MENNFSNHTITEVIIFKYNSFKVYQLVKFTCIEQLSSLYQAWETRKERDIPESEI